MSQEILSSLEPVRLKSAGKDIIANGIAHTFDRSNFEIEIRGLRFIFEFKKDSGGQRIDKEPISDKAIKLFLYNFDNTLGTGTTEPLEFGKVSNRKLYLAFIVHCLSDESIRTFTYTFFLGEAVDG